MTTAKQPYISFHSNLKAGGTPDDTLLLSRLAGREEISKLYEFTLSLRSDVDLLSSSASLKLKDVLQQPATITINDRILTQAAAGGTTRTIHGILASIEQLDKVKTHYEYSAVLVPRLWRLKLSRQTRIFQDQTVEKIVKKIMTDYGMIENTDFSISLQPDAARHPSRPFVVQYEETDFDFLCRWLEHEGIRFHFTQAETKEKIVFSDVEEAPPFRGTSTPAVAYKPNDTGTTESLRSLKRTQGRIPGTIVVKNATASNVANGTASEISLSIPDGEGVQYLYENHYLNQDQANAVAAIRKEEILCRQERFAATSNVIHFFAGSKLKVSGHYNLPDSKEYLVTSVDHTATQDFGTTIKGAYAPNVVQCIPVNSASPFRPVRSTPWPRLAGLVSGVVDGPADAGSYSHIDPGAAYKVRFGYDRVLSTPGSESAPMRMASPYSGDPYAHTTYGVHFPLHKGSEVVVGHLGGNPDQPVILGTVPNAGTPNGMGGVVNPVVKDTNAAESVLRTRGANEIVFDDTDNGQRIQIESPTKTTRLRLGRELPDSRKAEEPHPTGDGDRAPDGLHFRTTGDRSEHIGGNSQAKIVGNHKQIIGPDGGNVSADYFVNGTQNVTVSKDASLNVENEYHQEVGRETKLVNGFSKPNWDGYLGPRFSFLLGLPNLEIKTGLILELLLGVKCEALFGGHVVVERSFKYENNKELKLQKAKAFITTVKDKEDEVEANYKVEAGTSITLTCGDSSITLKPDELIISGAKVTIQSATPVAAAHRVAMETYKTEVEAYNTAWWAHYKAKLKRQPPPALLPKPVKPQPQVAAALSTLVIDPNIALDPEFQATVGGQTITTTP